MTDRNATNYHDSSGFASGLLLGLVLGAAGIHYLNSSDEGKEILNKLKKVTTQTIKDLSENPNLSQKIEELQSTMDKARETINIAAERVATATESSKKPSKKKNFFSRLGESLSK